MGEKRGDGGTDKPFSFEPTHRLCKVQSYTQRNGHKVVEIDDDARLPNLFNGLST